MSSTTCWSAKCLLSGLQNHIPPSNHWEVIYQICLKGKRNQANIIWGTFFFFCLISASLNRGLKRCLKRFCENYLTKLLSSVMIVCSQLELLHETVGLVSCGAMSLGFNLHAIVYQGSK